MTKLEKKQLKKKLVIFNYIVESIKNDEMLVFNLEELRIIRDNEKEVEELIKPILTEKNDEFYEHTDTIFQYESCVDVIIESIEYYQSEESKDCKRFLKFYDLSNKTEEEKSILIHNFARVYNFVFESNSNVYKSSL